MKNLFLILLLAIANLANADDVNDGNRKVYGRIISIDQSGIFIQVNGNGPIISFPWTDNTVVDFNDEFTTPIPHASASTPSEFRTESHPLTGASPDCNKVVMFRIYLNNQYAENGKRVAYALQFKISGDQVFIVYTKSKGIARFNLTQMRQMIIEVSHTPFCKSDIGQDFPTPGAVAISPNN